MIHSSSEFDLFDLGNNKKISVAALRRLLPDIETALFFGKVYKLDAYQLGQLLQLTHESDVLTALFEGSHSAELQSYLVDVVPDHIDVEPYIGTPEAPKDSEVLAQLFASAEVEVAESIAKVANTLAGTLDRLPSKEGQMLFKSMAALNHKRGTIGVHKASIVHQSVPDVLVILDVSGSMSAETIRTIIDDVVALSWKANAHLAIVSNDTFLWEPGSYDSTAVLAKAQYGGTQYETLAPLFDNRSWGTVVTIADYDSAYDAKRVIAKTNGSVGTVLDISLVDRPTFLGECISTIAQNVKPLLVSTGVMRGW